MKRLKNIVIGGCIAMALSLAVLYAAIVHALSDKGTDVLLGCVSAAPAFCAWTCKQMLHHTSLAAEEVSELNSVAFARYPFMIDDMQDAEEMLVLFLARGVDINAVDQRVKGWTALHSVAMGDPPERAALLLKYGARTDIRDVDGRTPLELARLVFQKYPDDPNLPATIQLLEEAERN